jgi:hypothetical protein
MALLRPGLSSGNTGSCRAGLTMHHLDPRRGFVFQVVFGERLLRTCTLEVVCRQTHRSSKKQRGRHRHTAQIPVFSSFVTDDHKAL